MVAATARGVDQSACDPSDKQAVLDVEFYDSIKSSFSLGQQIVQLKVI